MLDLFDQLLGELSLFVFLFELVFGLGEDLLVGSSLEGQGAVVGRYEDVVFNSALDAALADVEGIVGVII